MDFGADTMEDTSDYSCGSSVLSSMRSTEMQILSKTEPNQLDKMMKDQSTVPWKDESALLAIYSYLTELRLNLPQVLLAELKQCASSTESILDELAKLVEHMLPNNPKWELVVARVFSEVEQCSSDNNRRVFQEFWRQFCSKNYLKTDDGQVTTQKLEGDILGNLAECYFA